MILENDHPLSAAYDYEPIYDQSHIYQRVEGRHTSTLIQFNRVIPSSNRDLGNIKKDQFYLTVNGLDKVDFGTKNSTDCLQAVVAGTWDPSTIPAGFGQPGDDTWVYCAAFDKELGW